MSASPETHTSGLLYFIPHWIFEDESLSSTSKLVYALLSGLAHGNQDKECFPSDKYIGERLKISRQSANECVKELESRGAISKRNTAHPTAFKKRRYIKVHLESKESLRCREKPTTESHEKPTHGSQENPTHSNKGNSNKEESILTDAKESASRIARAPHVSTSSKEHEELVKDFGKELTQEAYERLSEWKSDTPKSKWKKNDHLAIRRWVIDAIKEKALKASKDPENRIKEVQGYIQSHPKRSVLKRAEKERQIMVLRDRIEILGVLGGNAEDQIIDFRNPNAKDRIDQRIRMLDV